MLFHPPIIRGVIDRRILVNFTVDPAVAAKLLPHPFRPKLVNGFAMAGICLIRLKQIRPRGWPAILGISSQNAAHRIAVEWDANGERREGVFIPRRDSNSILNTWAGGRLFPGRHHHAAFKVRETRDRFQISIENPDEALRVFVSAQVAQRFSRASVFGTLEAASAFFAAGSLGYSTTNQAGSYEGLELRSFKWTVEPLEVDKVESSFFKNVQWFANGSVRFDSALLMRDIEHEWHECGGLPRDEFVTRPKWRPLCSSA